MINHLLWVRILSKKNHPSSCQVVEAGYRTFPAFIGTHLGGRYRSVPGIRNCNSDLHGHRGFISFEPPCHSACQLSCFSYAGHSFFSFSLHGGSADRKFIGWYFKNKIAGDLWSGFSSCCSRVDTILRSRLPRLGFGPGTLVCNFVFCFKKGDHPPATTQIWIKKLCAVFNSLATINRGRDFLVLRRSYRWRDCPAEAPWSGGLIWSRSC